MIVLKRQLIRFVISAVCRDRIRCSSIPQKRLAGELGLSEALFSRLVGGRLFTPKTLRRLSGLSDLLDLDYNALFDEIILPDKPFRNRVGDRIDVPPRLFGHAACYPYLTFLRSGLLVWRCEQCNIWEDPWRATCETKDVAANPGVPR